MIAIVDYGIGNLRSVQNMLVRINAPSMITSDPDDILKADKLLLPGVGAFGWGMVKLEKTGLIPLLEKKVLDQKTPILGICLGMQLFGTWSEENDVKGLGWIDATTVKFRFEGNGSKIRVPHMGWRPVIVKDSEFGSAFLNGIEDPRFYFVHSYHLECKDPSILMATSDYGYEFPAIIRQGNILGVQFHPEKSHRYGMHILECFSKLPT